MIKTVNIRPMSDDAAGSVPLTREELRVPLAAVDGPRVSLVVGSVGCRAQRPLGGLKIVAPPFTGSGRSPGSPDHWPWIKTMHL